MTTQSIVVGLDELLDTRLATIFKIGGESLVEENIKNGYLTRDVDTFIGIDKQTFINEYNKRDALTLKNSAATRILNLIQNIIKENMVNNAKSPNKINIKVIVNLFPYKLEENVKKTIHHSIRLKFNNLVEIELAEISDDELSPDFLNINNIKNLIKYHWNFLDKHNEQFQKIHCPQVQLIVPTIWHDRKPTEEELRKLENVPLCSGYKENPFVIIERVSSSLISIECIPAFNFCIAITGT